MHCEKRKRYINKCELN